jgi:LCP family protein required for cell wall assembly
VSKVQLWWRRYVAALGLTVLVIVVGIVGTNVAVDMKLARITRVRLDEASASGSVSNFLVIGSDTRAFVDSAQDASQFGSATSQRGQRSDTMMIVHVDPKRKRNLVVSIPRDLVVDIPGRGSQRINAAFNDGPQKVIDTVKANFGVRIQHYVEVDFAAFQGIVNAIGRVPVYFPYPARDRKSGLDVPVAGCQALDGRQALAYVRSRYLEYRIDGRWRDASPRADLDRIDRQHEFVRKLADTAVRAGMSNPLTASRIVDRIVAKLTVDTKMSRGDLLGLVNAFRKVDPNAPGALEMVTLPNEPGSGGTLQLKQPDAEAMLARLRDDGKHHADVVSVKPGDVRVQVLNASGTTGLAGRTLDELERAGFVGAGAGNTSGATGTSVRYATGAADKAALVQARLGRGELVGDDTLGADADVVVVLGTDATGPAAPAPGAGQASTPGAAATAATTPAQHPAPAAPAC